jgi:hypothetical protein
MPPRIDFRSGISCFIRKGDVMDSSGKWCAAFLLAMVAWMPVGATSWQTLTLTLRTGTQVSFALSGRPVMTFGGEEVSVRSQGGQASYLFSELESFAYSDVGTAVTSPVGGQTVAYPNPAGDVLYLRMAAKASAVRVFDEDGRQERVSVRPQTPNLLRLDIGKLSHGLHIVRVDNQSFKILKK